MQKKLKPSMREKKRYIKFSGSKKVVEEAILEFLGVYGYAKASPMFVKSNILAVNRKELEKVKASFVFKNIKILKISGTLKGLNKSK
jgi:RNase P/RNase MRP subunit POP5